MKPHLPEIIATSVFAIAVLHTFSVKYFLKIAHKYPKHSKFFHILGEVEAVFGIWAIILIGLFLFLKGKNFATQYLGTLHFTEPMFVFVIMVIAASKPVLDFALFIVSRISKVAPLHPATSFYFFTLLLVPLLGSFITEPAAMTLGALLLKEHFYSKKISTKMKFATIGVLFVNISIGGVLTQFAAPPVLMVAAKWNWDLNFMFTHYGWRSISACLINAIIVTYMFKKELNKIRLTHLDVKLPLFVLLLHLVLLAGVVIFVHDLIIFAGIFVIFLGLATSYPRFQERLIMREAFLVALFLSGLVILGGLQKWWLQPILTSMSTNQIYYAATALTAITDNAALTYLGSLVEGLSDEFKFALVAGCVSGGGLTVIANAPNPAGYSILCSSFKGGAISPLYLFISALGPTITTIIFFNLL
jgi:hypothetical protein